MLAGRQFFTKEFGQLVPHFTKNIKEDVLLGVFCGDYIAQELEAGEEEQNGEGVAVVKTLMPVLQYFLANIVHHYDTLKELLPSNHPFIGNYDRNNLHLLKPLLGPRYEDPSKSTMKCTGVGMNKLYANQLDMINLLKWIIEYIKNNSINGSSANTVNMAELQRLLVHLKADTISEITTHVDNVVAAGNTNNNRENENNIQIELNQFIHHSSKRKVKKVSRNYILPTNFREFLLQFVFSNKQTKQTALRGCLPNQIYYKSMVGDTAADARTEAKRYRAFCTNFGACSTACECFLQHAWFHHQSSYLLFLNNTNIMARGRLFNTLYKEAWTTFKDVALRKNKRKRKLNKLSARQIYNNITGSKSTLYLQDLRTDCSLPTERRKKMRWTYKLPIMPLVDEAVTSMDDVLVADPITTTTTTTTATTTNSNNNINNPNSIINVDSFDNNNGNNNSSTNGSNGMMMQ